MKLSIFLSMFFAVAFLGLSLEMPYFTPEEAAIASAQDGYQWHNGISLVITATLCLLSGVLNIIYKDICTDGATGLANILLIGCGLQMLTDLFPLLPLVFVWATAMVGIISNFYIKHNPNIGKYGIVALLVLGANIVLMGQDSLLLTQPKSGRGLFIGTTGGDSITMEYNLRDEIIVSLDTSYQVLNLSSILHKKVIKAHGRRIYRIEVVISTQSGKKIAFYPWVWRSFRTHEPLPREHLLIIGERPKMRVYNDGNGNSCSHFLHKHRQVMKEARPENN